MYPSIVLIRLLKQKTTLRVSYLMFGMFIISGCASLTKGECNTGDWQKIGTKDGSRGLVAKEQLRKHQNACSKYQIRPNNKMYFSGYNNGIRQFCQHKVGFNQGSQGSKYLASCPVALERNFLKGYIPGLELAMDNIEDDIDDLRHRSFRLNKKLDRLYYSGNHRSENKYKNKDKKKGDKKSIDAIKKLEGRLDSIDYAISSKRSKRNTLRFWHSRWISKLN